MLWEELTSSELKQACIQTGGTCMLPFGVIEKHGSHLPLGTDMITARKIAEDVAKIEPVMIFPYYYFGQINEARHVPGTIAISPELQFRLLDEVCHEIARNGFQKIVILSTHGGNSHFIRYFIQSMLHERKDYAVYLIDKTLTGEDKQSIQALLHNQDLGEHAGNLETSYLMAARPELVKMENVEEDHMDSLGRLKKLGGTYTSIWWYADHPTHFAGNPYSASAEIGQKAYELLAQKIAKDIRAIKEDRTTLRLQNEFFENC